MRRNRSRIWAAVAGYPSCPLSSASCGASPLFARRIFSSFLFAFANCIKPPFAEAALARRRSSVRAAHPPRSSAPLVNPAF